MPDEEKKEVVPENEDDFGAGFVESISASTSEPEKEVEGKKEAEKETQPPEGEKQETLEMPAQEEGEEEFEKFIEEHQKLEDNFKKLQDENRLLQEKLKVEKPQEKPQEEKPSPVIDFTKLAETNPTVKEFLEEYDYLASPLQTIISEAINSLKNNFGESIKKEELQDLEARILHSSTIIAARPEFLGLMKNGELKTFVDNYEGQDKDKVIKAYKEGTADEVIWLIDKLNTSKKSTSSDIHLIKEDKEKKLKAMEVVDKKTTAINPKAKAIVDDSFEAGFEEAVRRKR